MDGPAQQPTDNPLDWDGLGVYHWTVDWSLFRVNWQRRPPSWKRFGLDPDADRTWQSRTVHNTDHRVIRGSIISWITKVAAVGQPKMIKHILQMYGSPCSRLTAIDLSSILNFWKQRKIGDQHHRKQVELHAMRNFDPYSKQWPTVWLVCSLMYINPKLNWICPMTASASSLHPLSVQIP